MKYRNHHSRNAVTGGKAILIEMKITVSLKMSLSVSIVEFRQLLR